MDTIIVLDFGSQYTQLIARKIRELNIYCEIHPYNKIPALTSDVKGVVFSGSPYSCNAPDAPVPDMSGIKGKLPLLAVCYGAQYLAKYGGGSVQQSKVREYGRANLQFIDNGNPLMKDVPVGSQVWMSHGDTIERLPDNYRVICSTDSVKYAGYQIEGEQTYAIQFHPEVHHSVDGLTILKNFVVGICGCAQSWTPESFIETTVAELRAKVGGDKVVLGLSGGENSRGDEICMLEIYGDDWEDRLTFRLNRDHTAPLLEKDHWLKSSVFECIRSAAQGMEKIREIQDMLSKISDCGHISEAKLDSLDLGTGSARISVSLKPELFYKVLSEQTGLEISDERDLMESMERLSEKQREYDKIAQAYEQVKETGYGIVMPTIDELSLDEPQIIKQSGKYGIRLKASAPSIHLMRVETQTEVTPIVGSEQQSEELVSYLLKEFEESPEKIWESNIFGKSVHELVNEGLHNKLSRMPSDARRKIGETIEKIINDGCNGLICIII